jgi:hypothetical protein
MKTVHAEWALIGKPPNSLGDYDIVARSKGSLDITKLAWQYVVGVPRSDAPPDTPAAPPWVTFGSHRLDGGEPLTSVSVQLPRDKTDGAGRPIWPREFFACRYADVAAADASYQTLSHAVQSVGGRFRQDGSPFSLAVAPQPLTAASGLATAIGGLGFERLATLAAAVLAGPVSVAGTARLRRSRRLEVLDAVAALLPYGLRADLSASTGADERTVPTVRLVLSDSPVFGRPSHHLDGEPSALREDLAIAYRTLLIEQAERVGITAVVRYLWDQRQPLTFAQPQEATRILADLAGVQRAQAPAQRDTGQPQSAAEFFAGPADSVASTWERLAADRRQQLLSKLVAHPAAEQDRALLTHWPTVAADVIALARSQLDAGDKEFAEHILLLAETSMTPADADGLLEALLLPAGGTPPAGNGLSVAVNARVALLAWHRVPAPGEYKHTCDVLRFLPAGNWQPALVLALLQGELAEEPLGPRAYAWVSWLCASAAPTEWDGPDPTWHQPDWMAALAYTLPDAAVPGSAERVKAVIAQRPEWTAPLLWVATRSGRAAAVLDTLGPEIIASAVSAAGTRGDRSAVNLRTAVRAALDSAGPTAGTGNADAARLLLGDQPVGFPHAGPAERVQEYLTALGQTLAAMPDWHRDSIQRGFLAGVMTAGGHHEGGRLSAGIVELLTGWSQDQALAPVLADYLLQAADVAELLQDRRLSGIWGPLATHRREVAHLSALIQLRDAAARTIADPAAELARHAVGLPGHMHAVPATRLAAAMYDAHSAGMTSAAIVDTLASTSRANPLGWAAVSPDEFFDVLQQFQSLLHHGPLLPKSENGKQAAESRAAAAEHTLQEFLTLIVSGEGLGADYGARFRQALARRLREREAFYRRLRRTLLNVPARRTIPAEQPAVRVQPRSRHAPTQARARGRR